MQKCCYATSKSWRHNRANLIAATYAESKTHSQMLSSLFFFIAFLWPLPQHRSITWQLRNSGERRGVASRTDFSISRGGITTEEQSHMRVLRQWPLTTVNRGANCGGVDLVRRELSKTPLFSRTELVPQAQGNQGQLGGPCRSDGTCCRR